MKRALVTGGSGFLGQAIVWRLLQRGVVVHSLARSYSKTLAEWGVHQFQGDISDPVIVQRAAEQCDTVFHVAAKAGIWGPRAEYDRINVVGTENVLEACENLGIRRLIYTSSPSVTFAGHDQNGVDESEPYPRRYLAHYPRTKAEAEQLVRLANSKMLATVALRPHLIWGPGDNHLVPRLLARAREGKLRRIGQRPNLVDTIYIDNAADAHLNAADRLEPGSPIAGKVYFVSQGEPEPLWDFINRLLAVADLPPVTRTVSAKVAYIVGAWLETWYGLCGRRDEPPMTRFVALQLSTAHWFDLSAARRDLGYVPRVSTAEGLQRLRDWLQQQQSRTAS